MAAKPFSVSLWWDLRNGKSWETEFGNFLSYGSTTLPANLYFISQPLLGAKQMSVITCEALYIACGLSSVGRAFDWSETSVNSAIECCVIERSCVQSTQTTDSKLSKKKALFFFPFGVLKKLHTWVIEQGFSLWFSFSGDAWKSFVFTKWNSIKDACFL